jgi:hypothetical protein
MKNYRMLFLSYQIITNVEPINGVEVLTHFRVRYAGNLDYYPNSPLTCDGYHLTYYSFDEKNQLLMNSFYLSEEDIDGKFVLLKDLTENQIKAIARSSRIDEIFED